jgi:hypothetical protein
MLIGILAWGAEARGSDSEEGAVFGSTIYLPLTTRYHPKETIFGYEWSKIANNHGLQEMGDAGATWVRRAGIWWPDVEPTKGTYDWTALTTFETEFMRARSKDMQVIIVVRGTPDWAQADPPYDQTCGRIKTTEFASFAAFVRELVKRYSVAPYYVKYWQIWNEPDVDPSLVGPGMQWFGCWGDDGDPYYGGGYFADMLKVVYPEIKAENPGAQVIAGGLLMDCDPINPPVTCNNPTMSKFLQGILINGGGPYFDGVGFHAYDFFNWSLGGYFNSGWNANWNTTGPSVGLKAAYLKGILTTYGFPDKFLMNTESAMICMSGDPAICETTKAYFLVQSYVVSLVQGLKANVWYFWMERGAGLLEADLTKLEAYYAYAFAREELKDASYNQEITDYAGVRAYELNDEGGTIWVMWSLDGADHNGLVLPGTPDAVYDPFGNPITPAGTIDITLMPVYVEWDS